MQSKEISIAPGFTVTTTGEVFDRDGVTRPVYKNGDGYLGVSLKMPNGEWVTHGIHRLVACAFVRNDKPGIRNQVNHFDMDKENNTPPNLDWVTDKENLIHAGLCDELSLRKKLVLRSPVHGKFMVSTLAEASSITSIPAREIWDVVKGDAVNIHWSIEYISHGSRIPQDLKYKNNTVNNWYRRRIKVKDLLTGLITVYESFRDAAKSLGTIPTAVQHALMRDEKIRSLKRRYLVVDEDKPFPSVTLDDVISKVRNIPKPVMAYHVETKAWYIFGTVKEFIALSGLPKKLVRGRLSKGILTKDTGWVFMYKEGVIDAVIKMTEYLQKEARVNGDVQIPVS